MRLMLSRNRRRQRPAYAAVMAMLFLLLIGAMVTGFYSLVTTSTAIAHNDTAASDAMAAAESGVEITRYYLQRAVLSTNADSFLDSVAASLETNMGRQDLTLNAAGYYEIPQTAVRANGPTYTVQLSDTTDAATAPGFYRLKVLVIGRPSSGSVTRKIQMTYDVTVQAAAYSGFSPFAGMVSKKTIHVSNGTVQVRNADGTYSKTVFGVKKNGDVTVNAGATPYQGAPMNPDPSTVPRPNAAPPAPLAKPKPSAQPPSPGPKPVESDYPKNPDYKAALRIWEDVNANYSKWLADTAAWNAYNTALATYHADMAAYEIYLDGFYANKLGVQKYGDQAVFPTIPASFYTALEAAAAAQVGNPNIAAKDRITVVGPNGSAPSSYTGIVYFKKGASPVTINGGAQINGVIIVEPDPTRMMDVTLQGGNVELNTSTANAPQFLVDQGYGNFMFIAPTASLSFRASMNRGESQEGGIIYCGSLSTSQQTKINLSGAIISEGDITIAPNGGEDSGVNIVLPAAGGGSSGGGSGSVSHQTLVMIPGEYLETR